MFTEKAEITVTAGREREFESVLVEARAILRKAKGFTSIRVGRGVERPSTFVLLIGWETVEDHTAGFRQSELYTRWRELIGPFFADVPVVEHFEDLPTLTL